jgi:hypothetical protein
VCSGCVAYGVAFEWRAGASVTAGNEDQEEGETGVNDPKQILLQHQRSESGGARAPQAIALS